MKQCTYAHFYIGVLEIELYDWNTMQSSHLRSAIFLHVTLGAIFLFVAAFFMQPLHVAAYEPTETTVTGSTNTTINGGSTGSISTGGLNASGGVNGTSLGGSGTVNAGTGVSGSYGSGGTLNASGGANTGGSGGSSLLGNDTGSGAGSWSAFQSWATGGTSDGSGSSNNNTNKNTSVWSNVWSTSNGGGSAVRNGTTITGGSVGETQQDPNYFVVTAKKLWGSWAAGTHVLPNASYLFSPTSITNTPPDLVGGRYFTTGFFTQQSMVLSPSAGNLVGGNVLPTSLQTGVNAVPVAGFSGRGVAMTDTSNNIVTTLTGTWKGVQQVVSDVANQTADNVEALLTGRDVGTVSAINNKNPGNIRCDGVGGTQWQGQGEGDAGCTGPNRTGFVVFTGPADATCDVYCAGIRAGLINLKNYQAKHPDFNPTIANLVNKWAPAGDGANDPATYIAQVANLTGYRADETINLTDPVVATNVFMAIMTNENSGLPSAGQILSGVNAAFGASAGVGHALVGDANSSQITIVNTTTNTAEGTIQAAPNPSDQPLAQQFVDIAGNSFANGVRNILTGKQSPNEAIAGGVIGAVSGVLPLLFSGNGVSVPVSPETQTAVTNTISMVLQYAPGVGGGASNSALDAINSIAGPPSQTQTTSGTAVSDANATADVIINDDKHDNGYTPTGATTKAGTVASVLGEGVSSVFNFIKKVYGGSSDNQPTSGLSASGGVNGGPNATKPGGTATLKPTDLSGGFTGPIDPTQTGSFVKADPVTGKPVATGATTPAGVYYDRGLAVALELNTKEQALKKAGVDYTVKDGEIYVTTNVGSGKTVLPTETQVVNSPEYQSGVITFIKGTNLNIDKLAPKDQKALIAVIPGMIRIGNDTTLSDDDKKAQVQALLKAEGLDPLKLLGIVPSDAVQKGFLGIPTGVDQTKLGFGDQTEATAKMQEIYDNAAKTLTKAEPGSTVPKVTSFDSLSTKDQAKYLGVSDTEYQSIQKISDTAFGAETAGTKTTATANLTLVKVVNTTVEDAKCRSSIVCSIAVAPFGGVEGARKTFDTIMAQNSPSTPGLFPVAGMTRIFDDPSKNDTFGASRGSSGRLHAGDDIYVPTGTPVVAVMDGVVRRADNDDPTGYGLRIDIEYPDGTVQRMAHLGKIEVQPGQTVKAGQEVGLSGRSGIESAGIGDHVHYEVIKKDAYDSGQARSVYDEKTLEEGRIDPAAYFENLNAKAAVAKPTVSNPTNLPLKAAYDLFNKVFPRPQEVVVDSGTAQKFLNGGQPTETPIVNGGGTGGGGQPGATTPPRPNAGDLINPWANGGSGGNNNGGSRGTTSTTTVATSTNNFIGNFLGGLFGGVGGGRNGTGNSTGQSGDIGSSITGLVGNIFGTILGGVTGSPSGGMNGIGGILQGFGNIFGNVFGQALSGNNAGGTGQNGGGTGNQNQGVTPLVAERPDIVCNPNSVRANQPTAVTVSWVCYGSTSADGIGFPIRAGAPAANIVINVGATSTSWLSYGIRCSNGTTRSCVIPVN